MSGKCLLGKSLSGFSLGIVVCSMAATITLADPVDPRSTSGAYQEDQPQPISVFLADGTLLGQNTRVLDQHPVAGDGTVTRDISDPGMSAKLQVVGTSQYSSSYGYASIYGTGDAIDGSGGFLGWENGPDVRSGGLFLSHDLSIGAFAAYSNPNIGSVGLLGNASDPTATKNHGVIGSTNQPGGIAGYFLSAAAVVDPNEVGHALLASGNRNAGAGDSVGKVLDHVVVFENRATDGINILALNMPEIADDSPDLDAAQNFVTFFVDNHATRGTLLGIGSIHANTNPGVTYNTSSADIAEYLERSDTLETMEPGDVVGVVSGKISKRTAGAHHLQVISGAPAFTGNSPRDSETMGHYETVAFLGQVPVKVVGKVQSGDYIVASGKNDGTGIAIRPDDMTPENYRMMVGRAWESSTEEDIKLVNLAVGLGASEAYRYIRKQDERIAKLESRLSEKVAQLDFLIKKNEQVEHLAAKVELLTQKVNHIRSNDMVYVVE